MSYECPWCKVKVRERDLAKWPLDIDVAYSTDRASCCPNCNKKVIFEKIEIRYFSILVILTIAVSALAIFLNVKEQYGVFVYFLLAFFPFQLLMLLSNRKKLIKNEDNT